MPEERELPDFVDCDRAPLPAVLCEEEPLLLERDRFELPLLLLGRDPPLFALLRPDVLLTPEPERLLVLLEELRPAPLDFRPRDLLPLDFELLDRPLRPDLPLLDLLPLDLLPLDFFSPDRLPFEEDLVVIACFVFSPAFTAIPLTSCLVWGLAAALPANAPITPPTTAPTGPATLPTTAPVAAPAADFEMGGISILSFDSCERDCSCSSGIGFLG